MNIYEMFEMGAQNRPKWALKKEGIGARLAEFMPEKFLLEVQSFHEIHGASSFTRARHRSGTSSCSPRGVELHLRANLPHFRPPVQTETWHVGCHSGRKTDSPCSGR